VPANTVSATALEMFNRLNQGCVTFLRPRADNWRPVGLRTKWGFREGQRVPSPPAAARGSGSAVSSPSGVRDKAPAANSFWCILSLKIASRGNFVDYFISAEKVEMVHFETCGVPNN